MSRTSDTLETDFLLTEPTEALRGFVECSLPSFPRSEELLTYLLNLSGVEIETEEISLGLVLVNPKNRGILQKAAVAESLLKATRGKLKLTEHSFSQLRAAVHLMRESVLGWVPGKFEQPVLILDRDSLTVQTVRVLSAMSSAQRNSHDAYKGITRKCPRAIAVWLKPSSSIRVYERGRFICQLMRLRDAAGWAARNLRVLSQYIVQKTSKGSTLSCLQNQRLVEEKILYPLIEMSEEKRGGSVFVFKRNSWEKLLGNSLALRGHEARAQIAVIHQQELISYLRQDGCIVIDDMGRLLKVGNYFVGQGGRTKIAFDIVRHYSASAFVVSQDGPLYYYSDDIPLPDRHHRQELKEKAQEKPFIRLDFFPYEMPARA